MNTQYPQYYAELDSTDAQQNSIHFPNNSEALKYFTTKHGDDLLGVVKDDGAGNITVVHDNDSESKA